MDLPTRPRGAAAIDEEGKRDAESDSTTPCAHTDCTSHRIPTSKSPATSQGHRNDGGNLRPALHRRRTTARTRYIDMLLGLDTVPPLHNILASLFVWVLLAGYIVFPATFNSLQKSSLDEKADTKLKAQALATARNVPLLYVAAAACGVGVLGCV